MKYLYLYSVIRFVPDPDRVGRVNLGILIGSDEAEEWDIRTTSRLKPAMALERAYADKVLPDVIGWLTRLAGEVYAAMSEEEDNGFIPALSEEWMRELSRGSRNALQFDLPLPILADSIAEALESLWDQLMPDTTKKHTERASQ